MIDHIDRIKKMKKNKLSALIALGFLVSISSCAVSQTNKEQVTKNKVAKHQAEQKKQQNQPTQDEPSIKKLAKAMGKYIKKKSKESDGYFKVYDPKTRKNVLLKLTKIHKDQISKLENHNYFTCSDYVDTSGTTYDLDIFMHYQNGVFTPSKTTIHKIDGTPRYYWYKVGDKWKTKSAGHGTEGPEHVRH